MEKLEMGTDWDKRERARDRIHMMKKEGARIIKKNSLMFFLLGAVNYQICPKEIELIGMIFITVVPNNEIRTLNIYHKK